MSRHPKPSTGTLPQIGFISKYNKYCTKSFGASSITPLFTTKHVTHCITIKIIKNTVWKARRSTNIFEHWKWELNYVNYSKGKTVH